MCLSVICFKASPGTHSQENIQLRVENVSNLTLIGSDAVLYNSSPLGIPMATSRISCRKGKTSFSFCNVTELGIARLTFSECGKAGATLLLSEVSTVVLNSVTIRNSTGTGLIGINLEKSLIHHSALMFNQATSASPWSGNIMLLYENCSEMIETYTLNITSSRILFGNATTDYYSKHMGWVAVCKLKIVGSCCCNAVPSKVCCVGFAVKVVSALHSWVCVKHGHMLCAYII